MMRSLFVLLIALVTIGIVASFGGQAEALEAAGIVGVYDLIAGSDQREVERAFYGSPPSLRLFLLPDMTCITTDYRTMWTWELEGDRLTMTQTYENNDGEVVERSMSFTVAYANDILTVTADEGEDALWSAGTTHFKRR